MNQDDYKFNDPWNSDANKPKDDTITFGEILDNFKSWLLDVLGLLAVAFVLAGNGIYGYVLYQTADAAAKHPDKVADKSNLNETNFDKKVKSSKSGKSLIEKITNYKELFK